MRAQIVLLLLIWKKLLNFLQAETYSELNSFFYIASGLVFQRDSSLKELLRNQIKWNKHVQYAKFNQESANQENGIN